MKCGCGAEMNHHADKPVEPQTREEADAQLVIEEAYQCPTCGAIASKRETQ